MGVLPHHQNAGVCGWNLLAGTDWFPQQKTGSQLRSAVPMFLPSYLYSMCNHEDRNVGVRLPIRALYITQCPVRAKYFMHQPVGTYDRLTNKTKLYFTPANMSKIYHTQINKSKIYHTLCYEFGVKFVAQICCIAYKKFDWETSFVCLGLIILFKVNSD